VVAPALRKIYNTSGWTRARVRGKARSADLVL
jgi:hypothetical protein